MVSHADWNRDHFVRRVSANSYLSEEQSITVATADTNAPRVSPTLTHTPTEASTANLIQQPGLLVHPYLGETTPTSVVIAWATDRAGTSEIHYSLDQSYGHTAIATSSIYDGKYWHSATVAGLTEETTYYYKAYTDGYDVTARSEITFTTAPASTTTQPWTFVALGDGRPNGSSFPPSQGALDVAAELERHNFDLVLHAGDIVYRGGICAGDDSSWNQYIRSYFNLYRETVGDTPFYLSIGNHDLSGGDCGYQSYKNVYYMPENSPPGDEKEYYSFDWGNAHFVALDTNQSFSTGSTQYNWLVDDLQTTTEPWTFVFFHHPAYSSGKHGSDSGVQNHLAPIFETYGVDVVFNGHDHHYERTCPILNDACTTPQDGGVVYYVTGGAGAPPYNVHGDWFTAYADRLYHFIKAEVIDCRLRLDAIDRSGIVFDSYEIDHCNALTAPDIVSTPTTEAFVNEPYSYDVDATGEPPPTYTLGVAPPDMSINEITGEISWTPGVTDNLTVTVEAINSVGIDAQAFTITVQDTYNLAVNTVGLGSVNVTPDQSAYHNGDVVTLTTSPAPGWSFAGWSGDLSGTNTPETITMDGDKAVTAAFTQDEYTLAVSVVGNGSVQLAPHQSTYHYSDVVTLTATPAPGWAFTGWSGDISGSNTPATITMDGDKTVTTTFTQDAHTLTVNVIGNGSVVLAPNQSTYHYGDAVTLSTNPDAGWSFDGWGGDLSGSVHPVELKIDYSKLVTATFANHPPVLDPIGNQVITAGLTLSFTVSASDPEGIIPSLSGSNLLAGASFTGNGTGTALFSWTTGSKDVGDHTATFIASDGVLTDTETITITVNREVYRIFLPFVSGNDSPALASAPIQLISHDATHRTYPTQ